MASHSSWPMIHSLHASQRLTETATATEALVPTVQGANCHWLQNCLAAVLMCCSNVWHCSIAVNRNGDRRAEWENISSTNWQWCRWWAERERERKCCMPKCKRLCSGKQRRTRQWITATHRCRLFFFRGTEYVIVIRHILSHCQTCATVSLCLVCFVGRPEWRAREKDHFAWRKTNKGT